MAKKKTSSSKSPRPKNSPTQKPKKIEDVPYTTLRVETQDFARPGVLTVTLNRPQVRNAFNEVLIAELTRVFEAHARDPKIKIVLLKGEGQTFCAGGDLNWMKNSIEFTPKQNLKDTSALAHLFGLMNTYPKPVVGAIHGAALGGGVGLVSICDIAIATSDTIFSLSEVRLGLIPACIAPFVISKIGASHARALFISAERFGAEKAKEIGLVHQVVTDQVALESAVNSTLANMLQCGPLAMSNAKKIVLDLSWPERRRNQKDPLVYVAKVLADLRVTKEAQEGVKAFLEKRKPSWTVN